MALMKHDLLSQSLTPERIITHMNLVENLVLGFQIESPVKKV